MKKTQPFLKFNVLDRKKRKIRGKRKFKIIIDRPPRAFVFSIGMKIENRLKKKNIYHKKKSKKNYTTYTLKILRFYETLLFMQFELLFSSICDFVKIDVLALPLNSFVSYSLSDQFFLAGCLFFCLLWSPYYEKNLTKIKILKRNKRTWKLLPYNLKEKQGPQNRLVLRVFDLYF